MENTAQEGIEGEEVKAADVAVLALFGVLATCCSGKSGSAGQGDGAGDAAPGAGSGGGAGATGRGGTAGESGASGASGGASSGASGLAGQGGASCPSDATSCPSGCDPMLAFPYDAARACVRYEMLLTVGCREVGGGTADAPCVKRVRDGAIFVASSGSAFRSSPAWTTCSDSEQEQASRLCPAEPCAQGSVSTATGCMTCDDARQAVDNEKEYARTKLSSCALDSDCACVPNSTLCAGACLVTVAKDAAQSYQRVLDGLGKAYCSDSSFTSICGTITPRCVACIARCELGTCVLVY